LSIASNIQWYALIPHKAYSFITTLFLGPFDDVITKFYCSNTQQVAHYEDFEVVHEIKGAPIFLNTRK
jgi:hypothetical protein